MTSKRPWEPVLAECKSLYVLVARFNRIMPQLAEAGRELRSLREARRCADAARTPADAPTPPSARHKELCRQVDDMVRYARAVERDVNDGVENLFRFVDALPNAAEADLSFLVQARGTRTSDKFKHAVRDPSYDVLLAAAVSVIEYVRCFEGAEALAKAARRAAIGCKDPTREDAIVTESLNRLGNVQRRAYRAATAILRDRHDLSLADAEEVYRAIAEHGVDVDGERYDLPTVGTFKRYLREAQRAIRAASGLTVGPSRSIVRPNEL